MSLFKTFFLTFVFGIFLFVLISELARRQLAKWMRKHVGSTISLSWPIQKQKPSASETQMELPVKQFAVRMLDVNSSFTISPKTTAHIARVRNRFTEMLLIARRGTWLLLGGNIALTLVGTTFGHESPIPIGFWQFLFLGTAFWLFRNPRNMYNVDLFILFWINLVWMGTALFVAISYALAAVIDKSVWTAVLLIALSISILTLYVHKMKHDLIEVKQQALADQPLKMLFLWVFGISDTIESLLMGLGAQWRLIGSTQLLKGTGYTDINEVLPALMGRTREVITTTPEEVMERIKAFRTAPSWSGMYYNNSILCTDNVWQLAFNILLDDNDVACMNLCGFSSQHRGCTYELGCLINRLPTSRFVLLIDSTTDKDFLLQTLRSAWETMAGDSPNRQPDAAPVQIFQTQQKQIFHSRDKRGRNTDYGLLQVETNRLFDILCEGVVMGNIG
jgi:hypothetical protein